MTADPSPAPEGLRTRNEKEMEDILSSIRQIIEEDIEDEKAPAPSSKTEVSPVESPSFNTPQTDGNEEEILTLTREIKEDGTVVDQGDGNQKEADMTAAKEQVQEETPVEDAIEEVVAEEVVGEVTARPSISSTGETPEPFEEAEDAESVTTEPEVAKMDSSKEVENLLSEETIKESSDALADLSEITRKLIQKEVFQNPDKIGAYTVEGLMRELLKPMLKEWLDMHLPSLVKWIVTEQIEKMLKQSGKK